MGTLNSDKLLAKKEERKGISPGGSGGERTPSSNSQRESTPESKKQSQREREKQSSVGLQEHGRAFLCFPAGPLGKAAKAIRENSCMQ